MEAVIYEKKNKIAYVTMNRPEAQNALNIQMIKELGQCWVDARDDPNVRVIILSAAGERFFSSGNDVEELESLGPGARDATRDVPSIMSGNITIDKPMIAAINGWAIGSGMVHALVCDILIGSENAKMTAMGPKAGIPDSVPGGYAHRWVYRRVPLGMLWEMLFTGEPIGALELYRYGVLNRVVAGPHLLTAATTMAERIVALPEEAQRLTKRQVQGQLYWYPGSSTGPGG